MTTFDDVPTKTGLCASCVEEVETHLATGENGRRVWLCDDCDSPVGALRKYEGFEAQASSKPARAKSSGTPPTTGVR